MLFPRSTKYLDHDIDVLTWDKYLRTFAKRSNHIESHAKSTFKNASENNLEFGKLTIPENLPRFEYITSHQNRMLGNSPSLFHS